MATIQVALICNGKNCSEGREVPVPGVPTSWMHHARMVGTALCRLWILRREKRASIKWDSSQPEIAGVLHVQPDKSRACCPGPTWTFWCFLLCLLLSFPGRTATQVAVVQYGKASILEFPWNMPQTKGTLLPIVSSIRLRGQGPSKLGTWPFKPGQGWVGNGFVPIHSDKGPLGDCAHIGVTYNISFLFSIAQDAWLIKT